MRKQRGITLIEMIIAVVVIGVLGTIGSSMFVDAFRTSQMTNSGQATADQARYALERVARELREVKFTGSYQISSTLAPGASTISFTRVIGGADVAVTVARSGSQVSMSYTPPAVTSTLASNVGTFSLDFLQLDNSATTSASALRFIVITLAVTDPQSGKSIVQKTRVALRNT